jgi:hypothetical protein
VSDTNEALLVSPCRRERPLGSASWEFPYILDNKRKRAWLTARRCLPPSTRFPTCQFQVGKGRKGALGGSYSSPRAPFPGLGPGRLSQKSEAGRAPVCFPPPKTSPASSREGGSCSFHGRGRAPLLGRTRAVGTRSYTWCISFFQGSWGWHARGRQGN